MPTDSCRVIVNCFLDGRSARNNSPPNKISGLNFLKQVIETESNIESNTKYDLIILNHNTDYLIGNEYINSINNKEIKNGKIRTFTTNNKQSSFDGYNTAFKNFMYDYENWIFSEDDHLLFANNYYDIFIEEYNNNIKNNIGFLAFAPISTTCATTHSGGGFGLCKREDLIKVLDINGGNLPSSNCGYNVPQSEVLFTHSFITIGKSLIQQNSFSCYPINHSMCIDHSIHRNNSKNDSENYFFQVGVKGNEKWE